MKRPNLLVLGACGSVARAVLRRLPAHRERFGRVVLLDRRAGDPLDPAARAVFVRRRLRLPERAADYRRLLSRHRVDIVVDLTDHATLPVLDATDAEGASYVNTCLSDGAKSVVQLVDEVFPARERRRRAPHILCAGMNPGAVNLWVARGIACYGRPRRVVHFEHDSSRPSGRWRPVVTWSRREYLCETVWSPSGRVEADGVRWLHPNALAHRVDMRPIMAPVIHLDRYPRGFTVLHEENLTLSRRFGIPSMFVYAIDPATMDHLELLWRKRGAVRVADLMLGDNVRLPLDGADRVGVFLDYGDTRVYYLNTVHNSAVVGTNATCAQVAVGVWCALLTLIEDRLDPRIHFVGDLADTAYRDLIFANMRVEEFVAQRRSRAWRLRSYTPWVRRRGSRRLI